MSSHIQDKSPYKSHTHGDLNLSHFDDLVFGVTIFSREGKVVYFNQVAHGLINTISLGASIDQSFPAPIDGSGEKIDALRHPVWRGISGEFIRNLEVGFGTNEKIWLKIGCSPLKVKESKLFVVSFHDWPLEDREFSIMENESRMNLLFDKAPVAIQIYDRNGTLVDANKAWEKMWGLKASNVVGWYNILKDKEILKGGHDKHLRKALSGEKGFLGPIEFMSGALPGVHRWLSTRYFPLMERNDKVEHIVVFTEDVTAIKNAEIELKNNQERFRSLFENAGHGMAIADRSGMIRDINIKGLKMLGYSHEEVVNKLTVQKMAHPADLEPIKERLAGFFSGKIRQARAERRYLKKNGEFIWVSVSTTRFQDPATGEPMIIGIIDDISQKRKALEALKTNELKFRSVFEEAGHGVAIMDENGILLNTNRRFRSIFELTKKEMQSSYDHVEILHKDSKASVYSLVDKVVKDPSKKFETEARYVNKSGKNIIARLNLSAYIDPSTGLTRIVAIIEDITKRKVAIEKLETSEEYQHQIIDALSNGLMVINRDGKILQINSVWQRIIQRFPSWRSIKPGRNFFAAMSKINLGIVNDGIQSLISEDSSEFEMEIKLGKRAENWFSMKASKLLDEYGDVVITLQEITVRKRVEKALEESLSNYRNIYNLTPVMMHSIDPAGKLVSVSNFWLEKLGYQRQDVIGRNLRDFLTGDSKKDADIILPVFFEKGSIYDVSYHFVTKSGEVLETILSAIEEGRGTKSARSLAVVSDVTPLKKAERQLKKNRQDLLEAQSIARIGSFELDVENGTFSSSRVFDEILEIEAAEQKTSAILGDVLSKEETERVFENFKENILSGQDVEMTARANTLKTKKSIWLSCLGRTVMKDGIAVKFVGTVQDITKTKLAELEIQGLSDRLTLAMTGANIGVWEMNLRTGETHYEDTMYALLKLPKGHKLDTWRKISEVVHKDDRQVLVKMRAELESGKELIDHDFRVKNGSEIFHYRSMTRQIKNASGRAVRLIGVVMDITKDKQLLNQLESSLVEKDILVKEVHHRVKNNMQMISSILALKALDLTDQESKRIFDECTLRIKSMAVVHDQLYRFYNVSEIEISAYLDHLLSGLNALLGGKDFVINVRASSHKMNVDTALLCGLIVSELVANAFKHGFKGLDSGEVDVSFSTLGKINMIEVTNTGHPIPDDILSKKLPSLGMSLIKTFTTQLGGKLELLENNGFKIIF